MLRRSCKELITFTLILYHNKQYKHKILITLMTKYVMQIDNKRVHDFFKNNPGIDFEAMALLMVDFIEKLNTDMSKELTETINKDILSSVKQLETKVQDMNKEYIENIKTVIKLNSNEESEKISQQLQKSTDTFVDKLTATLPNTESKISETLNSFNKTIISELKDLVSSKTNNAEIIESLDSKLKDIQQPMYSFISAQQEQLTKRLTENDNDKSKQDAVFSELSDFLNKWKNSSSHKGNLGENLLEGVLNTTFSTAEIVNTSGTRASGDFIIKRDSKPSIMVENKDYKNNVNNDEVKKFIRDINEQQIHGIFLSQSSGIISKPNYWIDICDGKILVYVHNVEYQPDIIKSAVNIIDNLYEKLQKVDVKSYTLSRDIVDKINADYQVFLTKKELTLTTLKEFNKRLLNQIEDISFPTLANWLDSKGVESATSTFECAECGQIFATKKALASHKKVHKCAPAKNIVINT